MIPRKKKYGGALTVVTSLNQILLISIVPGVEGKQRFQPMMCVPAFLKSSPNLMKKYANFKSKVKKLENEKNTSNAA